MIMDQLTSHTPMHHGNFSTHTRTGKTLERLVCVHTCSASCIFASSANRNQRVKLQVRLADQASIQHEHLTLFVGSPVKVMGECDRGLLGFRVVADFRYTHTQCGTKCHASN